MYSKRVTKSLLIIIVALLLSGFTYAFAAANTVPGSKAGDGFGAISGYSVSNIVYTLDATTPSEIDSVSFQLDAAASTVKARVEDTASFSDCTYSAPTWTCTLPAGTSVLSATNLRVISVE